nr:hypothetical protein [Tanacetum cinerariifolium]
WELSSSSGNFFWQWEHITGIGKTALKVGMDRTFNSQQSSPKLDAASAIKFLELNALKSQQSSPKLDAASAIIKFLVPLLLFDFTASFNYVPELPFRKLVFLGNPSHHRPVSSSYINIVISF